MLEEDSAMKCWLIVGLCMVAFANPTRAAGIYIGVHGGAGYLQDADTSVKNTGTPTINADLDAETGWLAGIAAGYEWPIGFAIEGELTYRENELNTISLLGTHLDLNGDEHSYAMLANAYYRLNTSTRFTPYLGLGVGAAVLTIDARAEGGGSFGDSDTVAAYQAIAGVAFAITQKLDLGIEYRYFFTANPHLSDSQGGNTTQLDSEYHMHNVIANLTYHLR
jgi:outer membrane autotransporter protein